MDYQDINAATITRWIEDGWEWGRPIGHETYAKALAGEWDLVLTPTRPVPHEWFPEDLRGLRVLGLYEDTNGYGRLHELGIPTFWATLAQKPEA